MTTVRNTLILLLLLSGTTFADKKDASPSPQSVTTSPASADGKAIRYFLPKALFRFQFSLKTKTTTPGPFADIAKYFFELPKDFVADPKADPKVSVELVKDVAVQQMSEPDPTRAYDVTISRGVFTETSLTLAFGAGGTLSSFQSTVADHKVDFAIGILKVAADVVGKVLGLKAAAVAAPAGAGPPASSAGTDCRNDLDAADKAAFDQLGKFRKEFVCGTALPPAFRTYYLRVPPELKPDVEQYLNDAAAGKANADYVHFFAGVALVTEFLDLGKADAGFLTPTPPRETADAFTAILSARQARKKEIAGNFLGTTEESTDPVPDIYWRELTASTVELFAFDPKNGLCFHSGSADFNNRWMARNTSINDCGADGSYLAVFADIDKPSESVPNPKPDGKTTGYAYAVPRSSVLKVYLKDTAGKSYEYFKNTYQIPQFGAVQFLAPTLGNSTSYNVTLDPLTGALQSITLSGKPVLTGDVASQVGALGDSVVGAIAAKQAADKAAAQKPSDLDQATAQRKLAAEKLRIQLLAACANDPTQAYCAALLQEQ